MFSLLFFPPLSTTLSLSLMNTVRTTFRKVSDGPPSERKFKMLYRIPGKIASRPLGQTLCHLHFCVPAPFMCVSPLSLPRSMTHILSEVRAECQTSGHAVSCRQRGHLNPLETLMQTWYDVHNFFLNSAFGKTLQFSKSSPSGVRREPIIIHSTRP